MRQGRNKIVRLAGTALLAIAMQAGLMPIGASTTHAALPSVDAVSVAPVTALQNGQRSDFIMGVDVSELYALRQSGKKFYDTDGTELSALRIMQNHGVNYIRLRLWNDPTDAFGNPIGGGNTDLASVMAVAKEAKQLGMGVLLDFHYSDFWADPGTQTKPKAWTNDTGATLASKVYDFTHDSLAALEAAGALPDMVQIGNEINGGLLWPAGSGASNAAPLLQKASEAVRTIDPDIKIMIHMAGNSSGLASTFTGNLNAWTTGATAVDFDVIGISDYPFWHGTMDQNKTILETLASTYGKQVVVAETSYGWTLDEGDEQLNVFSQANAYVSGYTPTPQGQATEVRDIIDNVASVPDGKGLGVFYWGGAWLPGMETGWKTGYGSGWENQALFDYSGRALPSLDVFKLVRSSGSTPTATLTAADTVTLTTTVGSTLSMPLTVKGQYSDGYYQSVAVTWDISADITSQKGVYTVTGTINGSSVQATAIVTVKAEIPPNLLVNSDLENGTTGWTSSNASIAKPTSTDATTHSGNHSIHYWYGSNFSNASVSQSVYDVPNGTYTLSVWADGDAKGATEVPFLYATGYDEGHPDATLTQNFSPTGWNQWNQYSITVPVTSGQVTIGVNINGAAGAFGDADDFYFGLVSEDTDISAFQVQPVSASTPDGSVLADWATVPGSVKYITLGTDTPGASIYYTTNGDAPNYASGSSVTQYYSGPIAITGKTVIKAYASKPGYTSSAASTYNFAAGYSSSDTLVPDGEFETVGQLGAWSLDGGTHGSDGAGYTFDTNNFGPFAGWNSFNYFSSNAYDITLSQKVTGLTNGVYSLTAYSMGQPNLITGADGYYTNDSSVGTIQLSASASGASKSANVLNQGWNVWQPYQVAGIQVTDGTLDIAFSVEGSAGYWGYLDHVALTRTGDIPSPTTPSQPNPQPTTEPVSVDKGTVKVEAKTDAGGTAAVDLKASDLQAAVKSAIGNNVSIQVKTGDNAKEVQVGLPAAQIVEAGEQGVKEISVDTGLAIVTIQPDLLKKAGVSANDELMLAVKKVDTASLPEAVQASVGGNTVYDFNLSLGGNKISDFKGNEVQVAIPYTLKPGENPNKVVIYFINDNGDLEIVKNGKYDPATGMVEFKAKHFSKYAAAHASVAFSDTGSVAWATEAIDALSARGAINGVGNGKFAPNGEITRAEFAAMLVRAFDLEDASATTELSDVKAGSWYYAAIASAGKLGIAGGKPDGSFGPGERITRQDMAVMAYLAAKIAGADLTARQAEIAFSDRDNISAYASEAVKAMQLAGVVQGVDHGAFDPAGQATRAQAAAIVYRVYKLDL